MTIRDEEKAPASDTQEKMTLARLQSIRTPQPDYITTPAGESYELRPGQFFYFTRHGSGKLDSRGERPEYAIRENPSDWKLHINVEEKDLGRVWELIYPHLLKYSIDQFKVCNYAEMDSRIQRKKQAVEDKSVKPDRKKIAQKEYDQLVGDRERFCRSCQITIYVPRGKEQQIEFALLKYDIETSLAESNITSGQFDQRTDKSIGNFTSTRYHKDAYEDSGSVTQYKPPEVSDPAYAHHFDDDEVNIMKSIRKLTDQYRPVLDELTEYLHRSIVAKKKNESYAELFRLLTILNHQIKNPHTFVEVNPGDFIVAEPEVVKSQITATILQIKDWVDKNKDEVLKLVFNRALEDNKIEILPTETLKNFFHNLIQSCDRHKKDKMFERETALAWDSILEIEKGNNVKHLIYQLKYLQIAIADKKNNQSVYLYSSRLVYDKLIESTILALEKNPLNQDEINRLYKETRQAFACARSSTTAVDYVFDRRDFNGKKRNLLSWLFLLPKEFPTNNWVLNGLAIASTLFTFPIRLPVKIFIELPLTAASVALNKSDNAMVRFIGKIASGMSSFFRYTFSFNPVQSYKEASAHGKMAGVLASILSVGGIIATMFAGPFVVSGIVQAVNGASVAVTGSSIISQGSLTQTAGFFGLGEVGRMVGTSAVNVFSGLITGIYSLISSCCFSMITYHEGNKKIENNFAQSSSNFLRSEQTLLGSSIPSKIGFPRSQSTNDLKLLGGDTLRMMQTGIAGQPVTTLKEVKPNLPDGSAKIQKVEEVKQNLPVSRSFNGQP